MTNEMFAAVALASQNRPGRNIIRIDPATGNAINIGNTLEPIASLAFDASGVLYGVTGDCRFNCVATPETLFIIDTGNASLTLVQALGNGDDGEAIAFNPNDGMMYHMSGRGPGLIFEKVNLDTGVVTPIPLSGDSVTDPELEAIGFTRDADQGLFVGSLIDCGCEGTQRTFVTLTAGGVVTHVNPLPVGWKDHAFYDTGGGGDVLLVIEALSDVGGSGAVDVAVMVADLGMQAQAMLDSAKVAAPGIKVYVRDGSTGNAISEMTVLNDSWQGIDLAVSPDGGANARIGVLAQRDTGVIRVAVFNADDGSPDQEITYFNQNWVPSALVYVADAGGPGDAAFGVVAKNSIDNRVSVQMRRLGDGSLVSTILYFRDIWDAIDLAAMADIGGNNRSEVVVLALSNVGQIKVGAIGDEDNATFTEVGDTAAQLRDPSDDSLIKTINIPSQ